MTFEEYSTKENHLVGMYNYLTDIAEQYAEKMEMTDYFITELKLIKVDKELEELREKFSIEGIRILPMRN